MVDLAPPWSKEIAYISAKLGIISSMGQLCIPSASDTEEQKAWKGQLKGYLTALLSELQESQRRNA